MEANGNSVALVVSVQQASDGAWQLVIDEPGQSHAAPLKPAQFIIRLSRTSSGALRGTIRRNGSDIVAPFQCNSELERLMRGWLNIPGAE